MTQALTALDVERLTLRRNRGLMPGSSRNRAHVPVLFAWISGLHVERNRVFLLKRCFHFAYIVVPLDTCAITRES